MPIARYVLPTAGLALLLACDGGPRTTAPTLSRPSRPTAEIIDALHGMGGNPHFYILPPLVAQPQVAGTFDPALSPVVDICEWAGGACRDPAPNASTYWRFTLTAGVAGEFVRADAGAQFYAVNWHTNQMPVLANVVYRVRVSVGPAELGHVDVQVVPNMSQAKNVQTGQFVALVDGRTLPIKFRIEQGVLAAKEVDATAGGSVGTSDGGAKVAIPGGALGTTTTITVQPVMLSSSTPSAGVVPGTVYDFGPAGTTFAKPVTLTLAFDAAAAPAGGSNTLQVFTLLGNRWMPVAGSRLMPQRHVVSAPTRHFSEYAAAAGGGVAAGTGFTCGFGPGGVSCWGDNASGQLAGGYNSPPDASAHVVPRDLIGVSAGIDHACGVTLGQSVLCWGVNGRGQIGLPNVTAISDSVFPPLEPAGLPAADSIVAVSAGGQFACALSIGTNVYCWGENGFGQHGSGVIGDGSPSSFAASIVSQPAPGVGFASISAGAFHACSIGTDGAAYCWGDNSVGELGDGNTGAAANTLPNGTLTAASPVKVLTPAGESGFTQISAGDGFTCAVGATAGRVYCWGSNSNGQSGVALATHNITPTAIGAPATVQFVSMAAGLSHACGLATTGDAYCWGSNQYGQLGLGTQSAAEAPTKVPGMHFVSVSAGSYHTCGVTGASDPTPNTVFCWGDNSQLALGAGVSAASSATPTAVTLP